MSTLKTTNIQHSSSSTPNIVLNSDGSAVDSNGAPMGGVIETSFLLMGG